MSKTMKAMTYYGANDIRFEDRPIPTILAPTDAIIRMTKTTIVARIWAFGKAKILKLKLLLVKKQANGQGVFWDMKALAL